MATGTTPNDREFLFRLQTVIIDGGTDVLRNIFDQNRPKIPLDDFLATEKKSIIRLRAQKAITKNQYDILYPLSGHSNSAHFDITIIVVLLKNLQSLGLNPKFAWNALPEPTDKSLEADLCRLEGFRIEIAHISSTTGFNKASFQIKWTHIEQVLIRLNCAVSNPIPDLKQTLDSYKHNSLEPYAEKRIQEDIENWRKMETLEEDMEFMKVDVLTLKGGTQINIQAEVEKTKTPKTQQGSMPMNSVKRDETVAAHTQIEDSTLTTPVPEISKLKLGKTIDNYSHLSTVTVLETNLGFAGMPIQTSDQQAIGKDEANAHETQLYSFHSPSQTNETSKKTSYSAQATLDEQHQGELAQKIINIAREYLPDSNLDTQQLGKDLENYFIQEKPQRKVTHEGRILVLDQNIMEKVLKFCPENKDNTFEGAFGKVRTSNAEIPGLGIKVAVKIIKRVPDKDHVLNSATNEKLASRIMHFAIVPILAMAAYTEAGIHSTYCFLSPLLEHGDLYHMIAKDTQSIEKRETVVLTCDRRLRILYHLGSAISFLHMDIPKFRGSVIHLDVKTGNIVLDEFYNARLIDFGVSRELAPNKESTYMTQIPWTHGYVAPPATGDLTKSLDISNIGVVIRELLSGKPPKFDGKTLIEEGGKEDFLRTYCQKKIWKKKDVVKNLIDLSTKCLDKKRDMTAEVIVEKLEELVTDTNAKRWERSDTASNCEMCMVNPSAEDDILEHSDTCCCKMKVCFSCMRSEYLNPIICHSCNKKGRAMSPAIGGRKWGAVLIAGYDEKNQEFSNSCFNDVNQIRELLISKFPLVVGMREENVKVLKTAKKCSSDALLTPTLLKAFEELNMPDIHTVFIYYSGHYIEDKGFCLINEHLTIDYFNGLIKQFSSGKERFIVILDCCAAPGIVSEGLKLASNTSVVQLNACRSGEQAFSGNKTGSYFTSILIQGLTGKAKKEKCYIGEDCRVCCSGIKGEGFVTIENLQEFIHDHLKSKDGRWINKIITMKPVVHTKDRTAKDARIAYLNNFSVDMALQLQFEEKTKECTIGQKFYKNIIELKKTMFSKFMSELELNQKQPVLESDDYHDICCIEIQFGPNERHREEIDSLGQLMSAWICRRTVVVSLRDIKMIRHRMIGIFVSADGLPQHFENKQFKVTKPPGKTVVHLSFDDLNNITKTDDESDSDESENDYKSDSDNSVNGSKKGQQENGGQSTNQREEIDMKMESEEQAEKSEPEEMSADFKRTIRDLIDILKNGNQLHMEQIEVQIIFPCMEDEIGNRTHRPDFVCFRLIPDGEAVKAILKLLQQEDIKKERKLN